MKATVAVLSGHRHPRLRYCLKVISADLGVRFRLYTEPEKWQRATADARLVYGEGPGAAGALHAPAHPFLSGGHPTTEDLKVRWRSGLPLFFGEDLLACLFFAISRYEEYLDFTPDKHGRFPATGSHANENEYLHLPVVRLWTLRLYQQLRDKYPTLPPAKQRRLRLQPTYDIDMLWAYKYRGWKGFASGLRDLFTGKTDRFRARFSVNSNQDPYDILPELLDLHPENKARLFWLLADNQSREDSNPYPIPEAQVKRMRTLSAEAEMGIHPGYNSLSDLRKAGAELDRYQRILGRKPLHSRQHFLRWQLPDTYRKLRLLGITHEYSMGYADTVGWRAGTNLPFFWYDLEKEEVTGLQVHPFAAMDATLRHYLQLQPEQAVARVAALADNCRAVGGDFTLLWHNSSFAVAYGWAGWKKAYADMIAYISASD